METHFVWFRFNLLHENSKLCFDLRGCAKFPNPRTTPREKAVKSGHSVLPALTKGNKRISLGP